MLFSNAETVGTNNNSEYEARKTIIKLPQNQNLKNGEDIKKNKKDPLMLNHSIIKLNNIFDTFFSGKVLKFI